MYGFVVNTITVLIGSGLGLLAGARLDDKYKDIVLKSLGLVTILIGIKMAIKTEEILILVGSLVFGGLIGQWLGIEERLENLGEYLKKRAGSSGKDFVLGFVTASLLFCVGPMTIVGSFEDGLYGRGELIYIKSLMDCFAAMALSAALGAGVIFSAMIILVYQGALTLLARYFQDILSEPVVTEMSAAGGVMMLGIAINLLGLSKIKVGNLLPALVLAASITWIVR
ncbi:MAG: DUF554 domain-containing protein [candidate division Zixibacteria bacterium]|nr:DUF554 domain-containing protein [candidate division Zixibacteria bacterium]